MSAMRRAWRFFMDAHRGLRCYRNRAAQTAGGMRVRVGQKTKPVGLR